MNSRRRYRQNLRAGPAPEPACPRHCGTCRSIANRCRIAEQTGRRCSAPAQALDRTGSVLHPNLPAQNGCRRAVWYHSNGVYASSQFVPSGNGCVPCHGHDRVSPQSFSRDIYPFRRVWQRQIARPPRSRGWLPNGNRSVYLLATLPEPGRFWVLTAKGLSCQWPLSHQAEPENDGGTS
ncbi:hypothetical protein D3C71_1416130 [compost metagenome]